MLAYSLRFTKTLLKYLLRLGNLLQAFSNNMTRKKITTEDNSSYSELHLFVNRDSLKKYKDLKLVTILLRK